MTKYIFVTGGVVSGLGKGITAASLGRLLKCRGYKVASQKLDPYINIDPGTMSPFQHGEVYVTEDGAETDLDLGHYERFIDENLNKYSNLTTGKVYWNVLNKEGNTSRHQRNKIVHLQRRQNVERRRCYYGNRRNDRRYREPAFHRGYPSGSARSGQGQLLFHSRNARSLYFRIGRIQIQAHAALR